MNIEDFDNATVKPVDKTRILEILEQFGYGIKLKSGHIFLPYSDWPGVAIDLEG